MAAPPIPQATSAQPAQDAPTATSVGSQPVKSGLPSRAPAAEPFSARKTVPAPALGLVGDAGEEVSLGLLFAQGPAGQHVGLGRHHGVEDLALHAQERAVGIVLRPVLAESPTLQLGVLGGVDDSGHILVRHALDPRLLLQQILPAHLAEHLAHALHAAL